MRDLVLYRPSDPANYRKSRDQLLALRHVVDCEVDLRVPARTGSRRTAA
jgi:hypothetical protein